MGRRPPSPAPKRAPRETPPPSKWGRSSSGTYFEITNMQGTARDLRGRKLYLLRYLKDDVTGNQLWSLDDLNEAGVRWLKHKPSTAQLRGN